MYLFENHHAVAATQDRVHEESITVYLFALAQRVDLGSGEPSKGAEGRERELPLLFNEGGYTFLKPSGNLMGSCQKYLLDRLEVVIG